jgi:hypothetical protein
MAAGAERICEADTPFIQVHGRFVVRARDGYRESGRCSVAKNGTLVSGQYS